MSRPVSATFKTSVFAQETDEVFIVLLTLDHEEMEEPLRLCSDVKPGLANFTSRGEEYLSFPFDLSLPDDSPDRAPTARISIDNVDRQLVAIARSISTPPTVTIEVIRASSPDTVEATWDDFTMKEIRYNALTIEGDLTLENITQEPYPCDCFTPSGFPGCF